MIPRIGDDGDLETGPEAAIDHVRNAWLNLRVFDHVDERVGGGYAFDPSNYAPIPVETDDEHKLVFAKV